MVSPESAAVLLQLLDTVTVRADEPTLAAIAKARQELRAVIAGSDD